MARRRGLSNAERLALDIATVTATGAVVASPCFLFSLDASLINTNATGSFSIGDTTAAADLTKESTKLAFVMGQGGASALCDRVQRNFLPPIYIANQLFFASANGVNNVSVSYMAAS